MDIPATPRRAQRPFDTVVASALAISMTLGLAPIARADLFTEITGEADIFGQLCSSGSGRCGSAHFAEPCAQHPDAYNTDYIWTPINGAASALKAQCQGTGAYPGSATAIGQTPRIVSCGEQIECLRFETLADYDGGDWNRSELHIANELPFRTYHYIGFMFKFPNSVQPAQTGAFFAQLLWQGAPWGMSFTTNPVGGFKLGGNPGEWFFQTSYKRVTNSGQVLDQNMDFIYMPNFVPEQWVSVVVRIYEDPEGTSSLKFWIDDAPPFTWYGQMGYNFDNKNRPTFNAKIGIYAAPQPVAFRVYFDEIRVGNDFHEAKPW